MSALDKSSPAEIVGKVMCGDAVETAHPFLESAIVGIDVLNMVNPGNNTNTSGQPESASSSARRSPVAMDDQFLETSSPP